MSEPLDNELKNRISQVFENYEDTSPAADGWEMLRQKFPEKKRRIVPVWWRVAATLLVLCMVGIWLYNQNQHQQPTVVKNRKPTPSLDSVISKPGPPASTGGISKNKIEPAAPAYAGMRKPVDEKVNGTSGQAPNLLVQSKTLHPGTQINTPQAGQALAYSPLQTGTSSVQLPVPAQPQGKSDSSASIKQSVFAQQPTPTKPKPAINTDSVSNVETSAMGKYLANEQQKQKIEQGNTVDKKQADKRILYSVYAGSYFNYADNSKSQLNAGAGFSTDIPLYKNLKITTGVAIGKNTLSYDGQPKQASIMSDAVAASRNSAGDEPLMAATPTSGNTMLGIVTQRIVNEPVVAAYNVSLTGLDIPLNLKYEINPKKSDSYISAGLSSGTFISETYNYKYSTNVNAFGAVSATPDASSRKSFTRFDFARTLNLSLGMGYQITKSNRLVIEPFLKYPLSGLGSQQIRFGAGGVNLRLKFQGAKK